MGEKSQKLLEVEAALEARKAMVEAIEEFSAEFYRSNARLDPLGRPIYDEDLVTHIGLIGLATMVWRAKEGDREAARFLVEKSLGAPEQNFSVTIQGWDRDEIDGEMRAVLLSVGKTEIEARRILAANAAGDQLPLLRAISALPAEGETVDAEFTETEHA